MDRDNDRKDEDDSAASSEPDQMKAKLKVIVRYLALGFAPVVSLLALVIAVFAYYGNQSNRVQINEAKLRMDGMSASMSDLKGEQELFKLPFGRERPTLGEERKKQGERETKIIKNVTQMQMKLKITPTLEEQLREVAPVPVIAAPVASAPVVTHPIPGAASAPAATTLPAANEMKPAVVPKAAEIKPATQKETDKKPAAEQKGSAAKPTAVPKAADKASNQVKSLRDAIKIYNQDN
jgi:hypothetical protein